MDDALVLDVIGAYRKLLQKAVAEYDKLGDRGAAQAAQLRFEIDFCECYLAEDDGRRGRARSARAHRGPGISDPKQAGRLVGDIMKTTRAQVDAATSSARQRSC